MTYAPMIKVPRASRFIALALVATFALPTLAFTSGCGRSDNAQVSTNSAPGNSAPGPMMNSQPPRSGMTGKQKVVLLAGAALLFYLYKRYQSQNAAAQNGGAGGKPQLYREEKGPNKGAIYYRKNDANHTVVWLQAPQGGVQVPTDQAQQALGNGFDPNQPDAYQPPEQINPNPQQGVNGGSVESADQYAGAAQ